MPSEVSDINHLINGRMEYEFERDVLRYTKVAHTEHLRKFLSNLGVKGFQRCKGPARLKELETKLAELTTDRDDLRRLGVFVETHHSLAEWAHLELCKARCWRWLIFALGVFSVLGVLGAAYLTVANPSFFDTWRYSDGALITARITIALTALLFFQRITKGLNDAFGAVAIYWKLRSDLIAKIVEIESDWVYKEPFKKNAEGMDSTFRDKLETSSKEELELVRNKMNERIAHMVPPEISIEDLPTLHTTAQGIFTPFFQPAVTAFGNVRSLKSLKKAEESAKKKLDLAEEQLSRVDAKLAKTGLGEEEKKHLQGHKTTLLALVEEKRKAWFESQIAVASQN